MNGIINSIQGIAAEQPEAVAILDGQREITFLALSQRIAEIAGQLKEMNIKCLGLHMDNSPNWIMLDLACLSAGITCVPLPHFFSQEQLAHCFVQANIDTVITDQPITIKNTQSFCQIVSVGILKNLVKTSVFKRETNINFGTKNEPSSNRKIAKITFTSGTTGHPKGVCLTAETLNNVSVGLRSVLEDVDTKKHLCLLPLTTLLENIAGVYRTLISGNCCMVPPLEELGLTSVTMCHQQSLSKALQRYLPNSAILIPQLLQVIVNLVGQGDSFSSFNFLAVGGAHVSINLLEQAEGLNLPVYQGYGLSECASVVSLNTPGASKIGSVGKPLPELTIAAQNNEIIITGRSYEGYIDQELFNDNTVKTGDIGYLDDEGYLFVTGRKKNLIISSYGRNVSPEWVESEVSASPAIQQCMLLGDTKPYCAALIVAENDKQPLSELIREIDRINQKLPEYARIKHWSLIHEPFHQTNGFLTANGRLRRERIAAHYADQINTLYSSFSEAI